MCGVFGIRSEERDVSRLAYFGLFALQHRGQESAGIAVSDQGRLTVLREMGLVAHVFAEEQLQALPGEIAIGHTRYSTTGANKWSNAQPHIHQWPEGCITRAGLEGNTLPVAGHHPFHGTECYLCCCRFCAVHHHLYHRHLVLRHKPALETAG